jgi:hypothetical protein
LLAAGRRSIGMRRRALLGEPARVSSVRAAAPAFVPLSADDAFVGDPKLTMYHRPECALAAGRSWTAMPRAAHESAGRTACLVCRP